MTEAVSPRTQHALALFAPLGPSYDHCARLLSLGQDPRWRRFLVSRIPSRSRVLDVATGTGAVALELVQNRCKVVGVDQSPEMLAVARGRLPEVEFVQARAEALPFEDSSFDALTVTYLLRYVDDPGATMSKLARVVRPGGVVASLEFGIPPQTVARRAWEVYTGVGLPLLGRLLAPAWGEVGRFLRGSILDFYERYPLERQLELWRGAGISELRFRRLSFGGGIVTWGSRW
jgi:demethylmenaquinone methyltransferase / 2-methoxy-6-polyprenyl-1,4-benzoquinol methylase